MRMKKKLILGFLFMMTGPFMLFLACNQNGHTSPSHGDKLATTGFFYFELIPSKQDLPFYFSQSISITYDDNNDLIRQQDDYFNKLRAYATSDGADQAFYNQFSSVEVGTIADCEKDRKKNIQILKDQGKTVKTTNL